MQNRLGHYITALVIVQLSKDQSLLAFCISYILITLAVGMSVTEISKKYKRLSSALFVVVGVIYVMFINGGLTNIPHRVMKILHLGNLEHASISTDKVLCEIFKDKGKNIECSNGKSEYTINDVNVLWRVGEYYIQFQSNQKENTSHDKELNSIIIDTKHVYAISWALPQ